MATTMIRVNYATWKALREMSARFGKPMQAILEKAIEEYRRKTFLEEANKAFAALKKDADNWGSELEERATRDATLTAGLKGDV
ncbi:MAG: toxin-antitoxin system protein [Bacillota bacterium]